MAVNLLKEGNLLKINVGGSKVLYWNSAWVSISFDSDEVFLTNNSLPDSDDEWRKNPYPITFTDFQYDGVGYATEAAIATILSDKIG